MSLYKKIATVCCALLLVGCQDISPATQGRVTGGVLGGVLGNEIAGGSAVGAITGALVGSMIGEKVATSMKQYKPKISRTLETSRSDVATAWEDPDRQVRYIIVPQAAMKQGSSVCRPFKLVIESSEGREVTRGVACRQGKDNWLIQSD